MHAGLASLARLARALDLQSSRWIVEVEGRFRMRQQALNGSAGDMASGNKRVSWRRRQSTRTGTHGVQIADDLGERFNAERGFTQTYTTKQF